MQRTLKNCSWRKVLLVSAHADDAFMGAGGFAFKLKGEGAELYHVVFTLSEKDNGVGFTADELKGELDHSNILLNVKFAKVCRLPVHFLHVHGHTVRKTLEQIRGGFTPDLVLMPSLTDAHQDHKAVAKETIRVFRGKETVLSYELLRNSVSAFKPTVFVDISSTLAEKLAVITCFKTQVKRPYMNPENFKALATIRGAQIGVKYAEAFEAVKMVL